MPPTLSSNLSNEILESIVKKTSISTSSQENNELFLFVFFFEQIFNNSIITQKRYDNNLLNVLLSHSYPSTENIQKKCQFPLNKSIY